MKSLLEIGNRVMTWKPSHGCCYKLTAGSDIFATLTWHSLCNWSATGVSADGQWTVTRTGLFQPRVLVHRADQDMELATLQNRSSGAAILQLRGGGRYSWRPIADPHAGQGFYTTSGELVVRYLPRPTWFHLEADVTVDDSLEKSATLSLLVLLGWYQLVSQHGDDAAAAIAVCCCVM